MYASLDIADEGRPLWFLSILCFYSLADLNLDIIDYNAHIHAALYERKLMSLEVRKRRRRLGKLKRGKLSGECLNFSLLKHGCSDLNWKWAYFAAVDPNHFTVQNNVCICFIFYTSISGMSSQIISYIVSFIYQASKFFFWRTSISWPLKFFPLNYRDKANWANV